MFSPADYLAAVALLATSTTANTGLSAPLLLAYKALRVLNVPWIERYIGSFTPALSFAQINFHPLSRGSVHINSTNPLADSVIDLAL